MDSDAKTVAETISPDICALPGGNAPLWVKTFRRRQEPRAGVEDLSAISEPAARIVDGCCACPRKLCRCVDVVDVVDILVSDSLLTVFSWKLVARLDNSLEFWHISVSGAHAAGGPPPRRRYLHAHPLMWLYLRQVSAGSVRLFFNQVLPRPPQGASEATKQRCYTTRQKANSTLKEARFSGKAPPKPKPSQEATQERRRRCSRRGVCSVASANDGMVLLGYDDEEEDYDDDDEQDQHDGVLHEAASAQPRSMRWDEETPPPPRHYSSFRGEWHRDWTPELFDSPWHHGSPASSIGPDELTQRGPLRNAPASSEEPTPSPQ